MTSADASEFVFASVPKTEAPQGKAILAKAGEHRVPYLYSWRG